jgi:RNA:NAD 2'-phosphotransferase (TPT1/KptA family)
MFSPRSPGRTSNPVALSYAYALLKTMVENWQTAFREGLKPIVRNHVSLALAARNDMAHASGTIADTDAISYLRSIQAVVEAIDPKSAAGIKALLDDQTKAMAESETAR